MTEQKHQLISPHTVILMPSGRRSEVEEGENLLNASSRMGVEIESICGGRQTCGKCCVVVEDGYFDKHDLHSRQKHLTPPTERERALLEEMGMSGQRLACAARVRGDLLVTVPEESRAHKQIIRKSATERVIEIDPQVRQVFVEVEEAVLGEHRGDWGRLEDALREQWKLTDLTISLTALRDLQPALREGDWTVTAAIWKEREVINIQPGYREGAYGLAVDVGSTTVAAYLSDLRTGDLLATESAMNPQISFGEDLMSRVSFAMSHPDGLRKLNLAVLETINRLAADAARSVGIRAREIHDITLVGNTTMIHILLGVNPRELGGAPFALANRDPMDIKAHELGLKLHPEAYAHILPAQAGHVGADNVGVLLAEQPYLEDEIILTVDVGTNAEIVLSGPGWMYSASSPTGPAFEGGQISSGMRAAPGAIERVRIDPDSGWPRFRVIGEERWSDEWPPGGQVPLKDQPRHLASGICGSGIIEVVAELFLAGLLAPNGRFNPAVESEYMQWDEKRRKGAYILAAPEQSSGGKAILITQEDVRSIQLAKAALYAGAKLLMMRAGVEAVDRVILAGAFGSYIDPRHAMVLGLIPDCDLEEVRAVGNAAGDGARIALLNRAKRAEAGKIAHEVQYIETAVDEDFQAEFVKAMALPHQGDPYPHLDGILPENPVELPRRKRMRDKRKKS